MFFDVAESEKKNFLEYIFPKLEFFFLKKEPQIGYIINCTQQFYVQFLDSFAKKINLMAIW